MKTTSLLMVAASVAATAFATTASAATCADRTAVVDRLETRFGELPVANAMGSTNDILEVHASDEFASWTILLTLPEESLACLVASGSGASELQASLQTF